MNAVRPKVKRELYRFFITGAREGRLLAEWVTAIMIAVHWGLGISVIIGGIERFTVPTYEPLIDITHGQIWIWGVWIMLSAMLMMVPLKIPNVAGLWIGMAWQIMWSSLFGVSLMQNDHAAATPVVAYAGFAMIDAALLTLRVIEKKPRRDAE
jgi:hypothetical protein